MEVTASNDVLRVAVDAQMIRYMQVALTTLLVYNCVLSWDDEVKYIWKNRFSLISVIYFIVNFPRLVSHTLPRLAVRCLPLPEFVTNTISTDKAITPYFPFLSLWINCAILWINQFILQLRLHALYGGSRKILLLTVVGFVLETITMIVCVTLFIVSVDEVRPNLSLKIGAYPTLTLKIYIHHASMMVYECLLFSVAFFAALRRYREELGPLSASRGGVTRLTDILIEGNMVCFFITMAYAVSSLVVLLTLPLEWVLGILNLGFSLSVIVGCHLILQIRKALSPTTLVYVIGEDGPAPSYVSMVFPYSSRRFARQHRSMSS
ncbi:hypothetical protein F5141DRAFT_1104433 [Pisolithus sp. B1]|nr:hypothetical protein F5141DRAFT_1104433 [Pisolithus sp. B1]